MHLLTKLYKIQSKSGHEEKMATYLKTWINSKVPEAKIDIDKAGNLYVTKGLASTYSVLVAHMD